MNRKLYMIKNASELNDLEALELTTKFYQRYRDNINHEKVAKTTGYVEYNDKVYTFTACVYGVGMNLSIDIEE